ncbi:MAG: hypothetical protein C5B47_05905 [Verrucomicrobia bacterium]|nr:MAG: hypothetical protein C5B47_05905 [Verrucomicrobiota bacterium]
MYANTTHNCYPVGCGPNQGTNHNLNLETSPGSFLISGMESGGAKLRTCSESALEGEAASHHPPLWRGQSETSVSARAATQHHNSLPPQQTSRTQGYRANQEAWANRKRTWVQESYGNTSVQSQSDVGNKRFKDQEQAPWEGLGNIGVMSDTDFEAVLSCSGDQQSCSEDNSAWQDGVLEALRSPENKDIANELELPDALLDKSLTGDTPKANYGEEANADFKAVLSCSEDERFSISQPTNHYGSEEGSILQEEIWGTIWNAKDNGIANELSSTGNTLEANYGAEANADHADYSFRKQVAISFRSVAETAGLNELSPGPLVQESSTSEQPQSETEVQVTREALEKLKNLAKETMSDGVELTPSAKQTQ